MIVSRWVNVCLAVVLSGMSVPAVSAAQQSEEAKSVQVAQKLFEEAAKAYSEKRYSDALALFRKAYTYVPAAPFLYNAARAAERMGNLEQALSLAKDAKAQDENPLPEQLAVKNDELIESLEQQIAVRKRQSEVQTMQWSWVGYSGVGASVVGLGLMGGAAYLGEKASTDIEGLESIEDRAVYDQRRSDIEATQSMGEALLYSGIGLTLLGGGMVAWDLLSPGESPLSVQLGGPGDIGASVELQF